MKLTNAIYLALCSLNSVIDASPLQCHTRDQPWSKCTLAVPTSDYLSNSSTIPLSSRSSFSHTVNLSSRVLDPATASALFAAKYTKGLGIWDHLESELGDLDHQDAPEWSPAYIYGNLGPSDPPTGLFSFLSSFGLPIVGKRYTQVRVRSSEEPGLCFWNVTAFTPASLFDTAYLNYYDPVDGVIIANWNYAELDTTSPRAPWSSLTYGAYWRVAIMKDVSLDRFKYVWQWKVGNSDSIAVMTEAHLERGVDLNSLQVWTYAADPETFLALLGTDNAAGVGWMLADYKNAWAGMSNFHGGLTIVAFHTQPVEMLLVIQIGYS
ncbi:hypothetical protein MMC20_000120 [Loxospora ochrophaea]|nr:hypothetical protein [Loxospora ochrophaea]